MLNTCSNLKKKNYETIFHIGLGIKRCGKLLFSSGTYPMEKGVGHTT